MTMKKGNHANIRKPVVAGTFYPAGKAEIVRAFQEALDHEQERIAAHKKPAAIIGGVVPHAGIRYCGRQAVHFFELMRRSGLQPDTVVIAHPNHYGYGPGISVGSHHAWETPLGTTEVDLEFADALQLAVSDNAQQQEHAAEVLLPWLQHFLVPGFKILPVNLMKQDHGTAAMLGERMYLEAARLGRRIVVLASSDFSHYLSPEVAAIRDARVLEAILRRDPPGVMQAVYDHHVSVCGYGPVMALMEFARRQDADYKVRVLRKGHSGEITPSGRVVSYASVMMEMH